MTLDELVRQTLKNMDMEADEESVAKFFPDITRHLNEAYMYLSREKFRVFDTAFLTADRNKILLSAFPKPVIEAVRVVNTAGLDVRFCVYPDYLVILGAGGYEFEVTYATLPDELKDGDDVPAIPEYAHLSLADFAAYRMLISGGREARARAQALFAQYLTEINDFGARGYRFANKY